MSFVSFLRCLWECVMYKCKTSNHKFLFRSVSVLSFFSFQTWMFFFSSAIRFKNQTRKDAHAVTVDTSHYSHHEVPRCFASPSCNLMESLQRSWSLVISITSFIKSFNVVLNLLMQNFAYRLMMIFKVTALKINQLKTRGSYHLKATALTIIEVVFSPKNFILKRKKENWAIFILLLLIFALQREG